MDNREPFYKSDDGLVEVWNADSRALSFLGDESAQVCVTSPPFFGLRKYLVSDSVWGGSAECEHVWSEGKSRIKSDNRNSNFNERWGNSSGQSKQEESQKGIEYPANTCLKCGSRKCQLGLESTPQDYLADLVEVFREVKRVLRKDGLAFVNLSGSYAGSWGNYGARSGNQRGQVADRYKRTAYENEDDGYKDKPPTANSNVGFAAKNYIDIPGMFAQAMIADGWILRQMFPWVKWQCAMPESVGSRPSVAHEEVEMAKEGEDIQIAWNSKYVLEFLAAIGCEGVVVELSGSLNSGVFKPVGRTDYLYVVMPMQIM